MVPRWKKPRYRLWVAKLLVLLALLRASRCFAPARFGTRCTRLHARAAAQDSTASWAPQHQLGDILEVRCEEDGNWYQAVVEHVKPDGTCLVRFDREGYEYHYTLTSWRVPKIRHTIAEIQAGELLHGRVTDISSAGFYVDVGAEEEGFVPIAEMRDGVTRVADEVHIGQDVQVRVLACNLDDSLTLSMKPSGSEGLAAFENLPNGTVLKGTVMEIRSFGAFAKVQPPKGGEPFRGLIYKANMGRFVTRVEDVLSLGQEVHVTVVSTENDRLGLALNDTLDLSYFEGLGNETWIEGEVAEVVKFGVFVSVHCKYTDEKVVGLVPLSELADFFVDDPKDLVKVGDSFRIRVLSTSEGKLVLSAKPVEEQDLEPFQALSRQDHFLPGIVQSHAVPYGAYVMVQPPDGGIACRGFMTTSDMALDGKEQKEALEIGQEINVRVLSATRGRLMLSMLPWTNASLQFLWPKIAPDVWMEGIVKELVPYGAFVETQMPDSNETRRALVHISEIAEEFVDSISDILEVDQRVRVRVKDVRDDGKVSLSMRPLTSPQEPGSTSRSNQTNISVESNQTNASMTPSEVSQKPNASASRVEEALAAAAPEKEWLPAVVKEIRPYGAKLEAKIPEKPKAVSGWLHISEVSDGLVESIPAVLQKGAKVQARVLNETGGKVEFSLRPPSSTSRINSTQKLHGVVENASASGAFIRISLPGDEVTWGYLPAAEVAMQGSSSNGSLAAKQEVEVRALAAGAGKIALTMRPPDLASSLDPFSTASLHMWFQGVAQQTTPIGLLVVLQPPGGGAAVKGFLHVSELHSLEQTKVVAGDSIRVRVLDTSSGRLLLSMKPVG